jgi:hypothetical protein
VLDKLFFGVYVVKDYICIPFMRCCENYNFKVLIDELEAFLGIRSDIKPGL